MNMTKAYKFERIARHLKNLAEDKHTKLIKLHKNEHIDTLVSNELIIEISELRWLADECLMIALNTRKP